MIKLVTVNIVDIYTLEITGKCRKLIGSNNDIMAGQTVKLAAKIKDGNRATKMVYVKEVIRGKLGTIMYNWLIVDFTSV